MKKKMIVLAAVDCEGIIRQVIGRYELASHADAEREFFNRYTPGGPRLKMMASNAPKGVML